MLSRTVMTATLLSLAVAGWSMEAVPPAPVIKPTIVPGAQSIAIDAVDLKQVAKARFYVSQDQGKSWTLAEEIVVDQVNPQMPKFAFKPQNDGAYYIVTSTVQRNGSAEPEPKANSIPAKAMLLIVDTSAPVVSVLEAIAEPITDAAATSAVVDVNWVISDPNFASATLEISTDSGATFVSTQAIPATGNTKLTAARGKDGALLIRILAKDAAGNQAPSLVKTVVLPQPPDPEKALAVAVSSLPTLAEVQPLPETAAKPTDATGPATGSATGTAAPPAASTGVAGSSAAGTAGQSATTTAPAPVATAPTTTSRNVTPPPNTTFLNAAAAAPILDEARSLRDAGDVDGALSRYLRLHDSAVAQTAVSEELAMLNTAGDQAAVAEITQNLPVHLRDDDVRLMQGNALLKLGRPADAEAVLLRVRSSSAEARPATLALGKAYLALGKIAASTRIFEKLAKGDDAVAQEAKQLRGK